MYWEKKITDSSPGKDGALQEVGGWVENAPGCVWLGSSHRMNWEWFSGMLSLLDF